MNRRISVLIVEDLPLEVVLMRTALDAEGDIVSDFVFTLHEALNRLRTPDGIDVVLLDLNLPDAGGIQAVRELAQAHPRIPVVVLSGQGDECDAALRAGAREFLAKPQQGPAV